MDKKGIALEQLSGAVIVLFLVGMILGIGIYVLDATSEAVSTTTITTINETLDFTGGSDVVDHATDCGFHDMVVSHVTANGSVVASTGNYSYSTDSGRIYNSSGGNFLDTQYNVTYTYIGTNDTSATGTCGSISTTATGIGGLATWIAVIVVVLAAAIVLGIVINSFGGSKGV